MPGEEEDAALADSESFKSKVKITVKTPAAGDRKNVETAVPLKYLRNFWVTLEMPLINCEINLILTWSSTCVITNSRGVRTFTRTDAKISIDSQNSYLECLVDPSFQGVNRLFVLSFEYNEDRKTYWGYFLPKVDIKDYSIMIDRRNSLDQPIKNDKRTYDDNIRKIATGQGDDYTTGCLLDYPHFKEQDDSTRLDPDADPKANQQINFTGNLDTAGNASMFFVIKETKETILNFPEGTVKVLSIYFVLI